MFREGAEGHLADVLVSRQGRPLAHGTTPDALSVGNSTTLPVVATHSVILKIVVVAATDSSDVGDITATSYRWKHPRADAREQHAACEPECILAALRLLCRVPR
jgi:hypothetical protein